MGSLIRPSAVPTVTFAPGREGARMTRSTALRLRESRVRLQARQESFVRGGASRIARRPGLEVLEERVALTTFLVTNVLDTPGVSVPGSLRSAFDQANRPGESPATIEITPAVNATTIRLLAGELVVS